MGTGAFLGRIDGETRCAFWAEDPSEHGFDAERLIAIDLAQSPNSALMGRISWDAVEVDDCFTGPGGRMAGTTLGPRWPEVQIAGVVYLEARFIARLPEKLRPACPEGGKRYEHTMALYWPHIKDARAGKRYAGHHATIIDERGGLVRVAVHVPGTSNRPNSVTHKLWIDLADPEQCDAGIDQLTQIGIGDRPKSGALFLIAGALPESDEL